MNTLFSPLSFLFKMQIGWIVNIMTVITPSCREIRAMSWNWSKSSYCRNHLKMNLRLISHEYRPQLYCIEGITFPRLFKLSRRKLSVLAPPVLHQYFAVLFFFIIIFRSDHLMQKGLFNTRRLKQSCRRTLGVTFLWQIDYLHIKGES